MVSQLALERFKEACLGLRDYPNHASIIDADCLWSDKAIARANEENRSVVLIYADGHEEIIVAPDVANV